MSDKKIDWVLENKNKVTKSTDKLKIMVDKNPYHFKTKNLGGSLKNYSNQMERDIIGKRRRNRTFQYGTLVYVDFGVNFGSEFSAPHYAVTLTKNDSKKKNTITVVPLTSKEGFDNLKLKESISKMLGIVQAYLSYEYVDKIHGQLVNEAKELLVNYLLYNPNTFEIPDDYPNKDFIFKQYDNAMKRFSAIQKTLESDKEMIDYSKKRLSKYINDLDKTTYVKLDAITTIDKNKIFKRKNNLDPLGLITLSENELSLISSEIKTRYLID
ncbi:type II toxin-antitoxin system PemK/MazF family toxin [Listeria monocytogenes]